MGRKSERIAALEKANADLIALNRGLVRENVELRRILDQRENGPVSVSVGDRVRSEFAERTGRLFRAVGL